MKKILHLFAIAVVVASPLSGFASENEREIPPSQISLFSPTSTATPNAIEPSSTNLFSLAPTPLRSIDEFLDEKRAVDAQTLELERAVPLRSENPNFAQVLDEGDRLLAERRWFDAKKYFEKSLRSFPDDPTLRSRFATARRRQELDVRYQDSTFVELTNGASLDDAFAVFDEVFLNINNYHVDRPSYSELFALGLAGIAETLSEDAFYRQNKIPLENRENAENLFAEIRKTSDAWKLDNESDARRAVLWIARQLHRRAEIPETATTIEFLCAILCSLDAYSAYLTPVQVEDVFSMIDGRFVGLGVELKTDDPSRVVRVIPKSPASECGVRAGDKIVAVDGRTTDGLTGTEVGALLQGESGQKAVLTLRSPDDKLRRVVATRRQIDVPSVENVRVLDAPGNVGYLKITCFQKTTVDELNAALDELMRQKMSCLVVDLRQNPGGLLQEAIDVSDLFLNSGTIVQTRGRGGDRSYSARNVRRCATPLVVLVDENSASASEIFAGAIQENGRGLVVGTQSYGKGTVQAIIQLSCETSAPKPIAGLRITTEKFYSPKGFAYGGVGVLPDVNVPKPDSTNVTPGEISGLYANNADFNDGASDNASAASTYRAARPVNSGNSGEFALDATQNEIDADPFLAVAVREANRLVAETSSNVATRPSNSRFIGVSTEQF